MNLRLIKRTVYVDILGQVWDTDKECIKSNNGIHLMLRKYIEDELLVTFSDGKIDKLATTKSIWDVLEFTPDCIKNIISYMEK